MVECQLPKLDVAGSSPVSRSTKASDSSLRWMYHQVPLCVGDTPRGILKMTMELDPGQNFESNSSHFGSSSPACPDDSYRGLPLQVEKKTTETCPPLVVLCWQAGTETQRK